LVAVRDDRFLLVAHRVVVRSQTQRVQHDHQEDEAVEEGIQDEQVENPEDAIRMRPSASCSVGFCLVFKLAVVENLFFLDLRFVECLGWDINPDFIWVLFSLSGLLLGFGLTGFLLGKKLLLVGFDLFHSFFFLAEHFFLLEGLDNFGQHELHREKRAENDQKNEEEDRNIGVVGVHVVVHHGRPAFHGERLED
jgi:hypothetical protein